MLEQPLLPGSKESAGTSAGTEWPRPRLSSPHPFHPVPISDSPVPLPTLPHLGFWTLGFWFSADSPTPLSVPRFSICGLTELVVFKLQGEQNHLPPLPRGPRTMGSQGTNTQVSLFVNFPAI